jgi:hypothetical protein
MLEELDLIDWESLQTAHGNASHVPQALRGLMSQDTAVQEAAYWKLDNHVVLQSDLYESAFWVIPFLVEILKTGQSHVRHRTLDLLFEIANGYAAPETVVSVAGKKLPLREACAAKIAENAHLLSNCLDDPDTHVSDTASSLLDILRTGDE